MAILRLSNVRREVGTFVILDDDQRGDRARRADRPGRAERRGQDDAAADRRRARRTGLGRGHRKRGLSLGLLTQESHFDAAFMAAPTCARRSAQGARDLERMERRLARAGAPRASR
jgi:hypothetical protein